MMKTQNLLCIEDFLQRNSDSHLKDKTRWVSKFRLAVENICRASSLDSATLWKFGSTLFIGWCFPLRDSHFIPLSLSIVSFVIRRKLRRVGCRERFYKPIVWTGPEVWWVCWSRQTGIYLDKLCCGLIYMWSKSYAKGAWNAEIHGMAKSRTRLSDWTELNALSS